MLYRRASSRPLAALFILAAVLSCGDNLPPRLDDGPTTDTPPPGPGVLAIDPAIAAFGSVAIGAASPASTLTVTNTGDTATGALGVTLAGADASSFQISGNACTAALAPGATCQIAIVFAPATPGARTAQLDVSAAPGGTVSAALTGEGTAPGALALTASTNDLGDVVVGDVGVTTALFTVTNTGGAPTGVLGIQPTGTDAGEFVRSADLCTGQSLPPAATCAFVVALAPQSAGPKAAQLEVTASPGGTVRGAVRGVGLAPARLIAAPAQPQLGTVIVGAIGAGITIAITNAGDVDTGTLALTTGGADGASFSAAGACDGAALAPGATCDLILALTPTRVGALAATFTVADGSGASVEVTAAGAGITSQQLAISPSTHGFLPAILGDVSAARTFTITNTGATATGTLVTRLVGGAAPQFGIAAGADGCDGLSLAPAAQCTVGVAFVPTSTGASIAELSVAGSPGGEVRAGLAGVGITAASLAIAPATRGLGSVPLGDEAIASFTITNTGDQTSGVPTALLSGTGAPAFALQGGCAAALAPQEACTLQVRFRPTALGATGATLDVTASPGGSAAATLTGEGIAAAQLVIVPSSFTFPGATAVGDTTAAQAFTIKNLGAVTTGVVALTSTGDVATAHACTTLAPGATCTFTATFTPTQVGLRQASVTVAATPGGTATTALDGLARPRLEVIALDGGAVTSPHEFGAAVVGGLTPRDVDITVRNNTTTSHALTLTGVFGTPARFGLVSSSCAPTNAIAAGGTCTVRVAFTPDAPGVHTGALALAIGASAADVATQELRGTGIDALRLTPLAGTDAGAIPLGTSSGPLAFRVTNAADAPTSGSLVTSLVGAGFAIATDGCSGTTLAPAGACELTATFTPTSTGAASAVLGVSGAPGGAPSATLSASGTTPTGAAPTDLTLAPGAVAEGQPAGTSVGTLTATDADPADTFTFSLVAGAGSDNNAAFVIEGATVRTAAAFDFETRSSFALRVRVLDSGGQVFEAALTVAVTDVDEAATAVADSATVAEDSGATALDVLTNDVDADADSRTITSVTQPAHGSVVITGSGTGLTYAPAAGYAGPDAFTYTLTGGSSASVAITVTAVDDAPTAVDDTATVLEDSAAQAITVLANDTDPDGGPIQIISVTQPAHGTVVITGAGTGLTYQPAANRAGADAFTYTLSGGSTATVTVTVTAVDDAPEAVADAGTTLEDAGLDLDVLANDLDADGGALAIISFTQPAGGVVTQLVSGLLHYEPAADAAGADAFTYTITGGSTATVTVTVTPVNDAPSFTPGADRTVLEDAGAQTVAGWATALSVGPAPEAAQTLAFTVTTNTNPALFSVAPAISPTGTLTYTPAPNASGVATLTVRAQDSGGTASGGVDTSATATLVLTVTAVNDAPSFTKGANPTVAEDAGPQTVPGWATAITAGPADEASQALTFTITDNTNPALFATAPSLTAAGTLAFTPTADAAGSATLTLRLADDGGTANGGVDTSAPQTFVVTVSAVDDAPVVTTTAGSAAFTEGSSAVAVDPGVVVTDGDSANLTSATVALTTGCQVGQDVLALAATAGLVIAFDGSCTLTITPVTTMTVAQVQAALRAVTFANPSGAPSTAPRVVTFTVSDGTSPGSATRGLTVTAVNTAPVVTTTATSLGFTEGGAAIALDGAITITDVDSTSLAAVEVRLTAGCLAEDVLAFPGAGTITAGAYVGAPTCALTLSGAGTVAQYQAAARLVTYRNTSTDAPSTTARTATFTADDGAGGASTGTATRTITITAVNDAPVVSVAGGVTFTEGSAPVTVAGDLAVSDVDSATLAGATVVITGCQSGQDVLGLAPLPAGITGAGYTAATCTLTLTGTTALAAYEAALEAVTYTNTATDDPSAAARTVGFTVTDGAASSTTVARPLTVVPVNDAPVLTGTATRAYTENAAATVINPAFTAADGDSTTLVGATITLTAGGEATDVLAFTAANGITGSYTASTLTLTLAGTASLAAYEAALASVTFRSTSENPSTATRTVAFVVDDGGASSGLSAAALSTVTVTAVNDAPVALAFTGLPAQAGIAITYPAGKLGGTDAEGTALTIVGDTTCSECALTLDANGGFVFTPPPGAAGTTISFTYHVVDAGTPAPGVASPVATVSFAVAGPAIYFVKSAAVGAGTCALGAECTLATAVTKIGASTGGRIYLADGTTHASAVPLRSGGWLVGQAVSGTTFDALFGVTTPGQGTLAARPTFVPASPPAVSGTVTLNTGAVVRGLTIATTTGTGLADPAAAITGVDVSQTTVTTTTGSALLLSAVAGTLSFTAINTTGAATAVSVDQSATPTASATLSVAGGAITGATVDGVRLIGGQGAVTYTGTIATTGAGRAVNITNRTGGAVQFNAPITDTGGINLASNTGSFLFSGGLTTTSTSTTAPGFAAASSGTLEIIGVNTITSASTSALSVTSTTIGPQGMTFRSLSSGNTTAAADPVNGIVLTSTGPRGLTVTGNSSGSCGGTTSSTGAPATIPSAADCTGGTIQRTTGAAILLTTVGPTSLTRMRVVDSAGEGLRGSSVAGLAITSSLFETNGDAAGESGLELVNLTGTGAVTNTTIRGSAEDNLRIENSAGTLGFTLQGSQVATSNTTVGNDGLGVITSNTAVVTVTVARSAFADSRGDHIQLASTDAATGSITATIEDVVLTTLANSATTLGGGIAVTPSGSTSVVFTINRASIQRAIDDAITIDLATTSSAAASIRGTITNSSIGTDADIDAGSKTSNGITITSAGLGATRLNIQNNVIRRYGNAFGLFATTRDGSAALDLTVRGNTISDPGTSALNGIRLVAGAVASDTGVLCADLGANTLDQAGHLGAPDVALQQRFASTIRLPEYAGTARDTAGVASYVVARSLAAGQASATATTSGLGGGYLISAPSPLACQLP